MLNGLLEVLKEEPNAIRLAYVKERNYCKIYALMDKYDAESCERFSDKFFDYTEEHEWDDVDLICLSRENKFSFGDYLVTVKG